MRMKKVDDIFLILQGKMNMKKFSDDTTVHGLKELYYSKKTIWKGIWIIIMSIATGLTIYQVGKSVQRYKDQPMITTIQPLESGKLLYPPLRICYLHWSSWVDWNKVIKLNLSKPVLYYGLSYLDKTFSQDVFDLNKTEERFNKSMIENNWRYLSDFYMAISEDYPKYLSPESEQIKMAFTEKGFYDLIELCPLCYTVNGKTLTSLIDASTLNLRKSYSRKILFSLEKLPQVLFNSYFKEPEYAMYIKYRLQEEYSFLKPVTTQEMTALFNPQVLFPNFASDFIKLNPDVEVYSIKIKGSVHKWQSRHSVQCAEGHISNSADYSCEMICYSQLTSKLCQMVPFEAAFLVHTDEPMMTCRRNITFMVPNISAEVFSTQLDDTMFDCQCNILMNYENELNSCLRACEVGCEKWDFEASVTYTFEQSIVKDIARRNYSLIQIEYPLEESIFVISEIDSQSWESFIADVGGLLGIWLGASIVSFVQTIYLCCFSKDDEADATIIIDKNSLGNHNQVPKAFSYKRNSQVECINSKQF